MRCVLSRTNTQILHPPRDGCGAARALRAARTSPGPAPPAIAQTGLTKRNTESFRLSTIEYNQNNEWPCHLGNYSSWIFRNAGYFAGMYKWQEQFRWYKVFCSLKHYTLFTQLFLSNITKELVVRKQWYMQFDPFSKKNKCTVLLNKDQVLLCTVC